MVKRLFYRLYKVWQNLDFVNYTEGVTKYQEGLEKEYVESDLINITITRDINNVIQTASINNLPYEEIYRLFAKYDKIEVYYNDDIKDILIFTGEIGNKSSNWGKGELAVSFELNDVLNLLARTKLAYITVPVDTSTTTLVEFLQAMLQNTGLGIELVYNCNSILGKFEPSGDLIKSLTEIRDKYALQVYGNREGKLVVNAPDILWSNKLNTVIIDLLKYPVTVNIKNGYSNINCIITVGFNAQDDKTLITGVAFDPITYRINGNKLKYKVEYAFDIYGKTELNKLAINKLLEEQKQFKISVSGFAYDPEQFELGRLVSIKNHPEIDEQQVFIIEHITENLSQDNFEMDIELSGFSLGVIPNDILSTEGSTLSILDEDVNFELTNQYRGTQS